MMIRREVVPGSLNGVEGNLLGHPLATVPEVRRIVRLPDAGKYPLFSLALVGLDS
jgi:hypothetical protein